MIAERFPQGAGSCVVIKLSRDDWNRVPVGTMTETELLHKAIQDGHLETVKAMLTGGTDLNLLFGMRGTPLCAAIYENQPAIVHHLISMGCDVNAKDFDGEPPLCLAIRKGYIDLVEELLRSSLCDVNKFDPVTGNTPLLLATAKKQLPVVQMLLEKDCDINLCSKEGNCETPLHRATLDGSLEIMSVLLSQKSCKVNSYNKKGFCPLHIAADQQNLEVLDLLLKSADLGDPLSCCENVDIDQTTAFEKFSALHFAVMNGNNDMVKLLISSGSNVNKVNRYQQSPLHMAISSNMENVAVLLLKAGADPNVVGLRPRYLPTRVSQQRTSIIQEAVTNGNLKLLKILISCGADINLQSHLGMTPLTFALMHNKFQIVEYFLSEGLKHGLDVKMENSEGDTALSASWFCDNSALVAQKLIDAGCSVHQVNSHMYQPIHLAVNYECMEVVEVLLDNGAEVNARDGDCMTPLHHAILSYTNSDHIARLLIFYGADISAQDEEGSTSLQMALNSETEDLVVLLMKCGYNASSEDDLKLPRDDIDDDDFPELLDEKPDLYDWLVQQARNPVPLSKQCATAIRQHFCKNHIPMKRTRQLPLPDKLLDLVMLRNI